MADGCIFKEMLPEIFAEDEVLAVLLPLFSRRSASSKTFVEFASKPPPPHHVYQLTCGLLVRLKSASRRMVRRSKIEPPPPPASSSSSSLTQGEDTYATRLFALAKHFTIRGDAAEGARGGGIGGQAVLDAYGAYDLYEAAEELTQKASNLSPALQAQMALVPFGLRNQETKQLVFEEQFLRRVKAYHLSVQRPDGTFAIQPHEQQKQQELKEEEEEEEQQHQQSNLLRTLIEAPRIVCPSCGRKRQIYCGECFGQRLTTTQEEEQEDEGKEGSSLLPPRFSLPFDVCLLLHWQESLHKCTGVHAAVMCQQEQLSLLHWPRDKGGWGEAGVLADEEEEMAEVHKMVYRGPEGGKREGEVEEVPWEGQRSEWVDLLCSFDYERDVLLFPCKGAIPANELDWSRSGSNDGANGAEGGNGEEEEEEEEQQKKRRRRLVVIESSWNNGKTMANQLYAGRIALGLPPLVCVTLGGEEEEGKGAVVGTYWRFHNEGKSAVSTIEAIAHVARAAGTSEQHIGDLLLLFEVQKQRVFDRVLSGGRAPRAIVVQGQGVGSWKELTDPLSDV